MQWQLDQQRIFSENLINLKFLFQWTRKFFISVQVPIQKTFCQVWVRSPDNFGSSIYWFVVKCWSCDFICHVCNCICILKMYHYAPSIYDLSFSSQRAETRTWFLQIAQLEKQIFCVFSYTSLSLHFEKVIGTDCIMIRFFLRVSPKVIFENLEMHKRFDKSSKYKNFRHSDPLKVPLNFYPVAITCHNLHNYRVFLKWESCKNDLSKS